MPREVSPKPWSGTVVTVSMWPHRPLGTIAVDVSSSVSAGHTREHFRVDLTLPVELGALVDLCSQVGEVVFKLTADRWGVIDELGGGTIFATASTPEPTTE